MLDFKKLEIKTVIFCDDVDAPAQQFSNDYVSLVSEVWSASEKLTEKFMNSFDKSIPYESNPLSTKNSVSLP